MTKVPSTKNCNKCKWNFEILKKFAMNPIHPRTVKFEVFQNCYLGGCLNKLTVLPLVSLGLTVLKRNFAARTNKQVRINDCYEDLPHKSAFNYLKLEWSKHRTWPKWTIISARRVNSIIEGPIIKLINSKLRGLGKNLKGELQCQPIFLYVGLRSFYSLFYNE